MVYFTSLSVLLDLMMSQSLIKSPHIYFQLPNDIYFLLRALQPPNWSAQWHCGIRVVSSNKLVGFIAALPAKLLVYEV